MSRYIASLTEKAQNALDRRGIGAHLPLSHTQQAQQPVRTDYHAPPTDDVPDGKPPRRSLAIENITNTLRSLHTQYVGSGPPELRQLQVQITNAKGIALDLDGLARDTKAASKDFYLWGQEQDPDIKDVSDRMGYLNFVVGSLLARLSDQIDASRVPLKNLRISEQTLAQRRAQRVQLQAQIQSGKAKGNVREIEEQLAKQTRDDEPLEREAGAELRKALAESERIKFEAMREVGEKLTLLAQAAQEVLAQLPTTPPTQANPYKGHQATAKARNTVQVALDSWRPGVTTIQALTPQHPAGNDARSFGETHASELSRVNSFTSSAQVATAQTGHLETPHQVDSQHLSVAGSSKPTTHYAPPSGPPPGRPNPQAHAPVVASPPLNPSVLNNAPAPIPVVSSQPGKHVDTPSTVAPNRSRPVSPAPAQSLSHPSVASSTVLSPSSTAATTGHAATAQHIVPEATPVGQPTATSQKQPQTSQPSHSTSSGSELIPPADAPGLIIPAPTVAETGVPISAGHEGPGPSSGSLLTRDNTVASHVSAAPEYKEIDSNVYGDGSFGGGFRQEAGPGPSSASAGTSRPQYESAEDEKRRLEREARERFLFDNPRGPPLSGGIDLGTSDFNDAKVPEYPADEKKKPYPDEKKSTYPEDKKDPRGPGGGDYPPPGGTPPPYGQ